MDIEECVKEWEDLVADYKRLEVKFKFWLGFLMSALLTPILTGKILS